MMSARLVVATLAVAICATASVNGFAISDSASDEGQEVIESLERQCLQLTGSTETFEKLVAGFSFAPMCFAGHLDLEGLAADIIELNDSNRAKFFGTYCPQMNESLQCINPLFELLRTCWDGEDLAIMDIMYNMIPEALNLMCKDHGEIFFRLEGPEYNKCVEKFDDYTAECSGKISNSTETMYLSKLDEGQCRELGDFRGCIAEKLQICKAPGIIDLIDIFYKPMVKASSCAKYINFEQRDPVESNEI
uniref:Hemolymph protein-like protein n=1 Tax=Aedes aegypti TaxID=7159 RepID=Q1HRA4_AEDAE|nr:hemolymph protein-like protein [Aedes aegypti]